MLRHIAFSISTSLLSLGFLAASTGALANKQDTMKSDDGAVKIWNQFADNLYQFHQYQIKHHPIRTEEETGGYQGMPDFYREVRYYDKDNNRLLSRIQWETANPKQIHVIEVYVFNEQGQLKSDYLAAFLPGFRNAPVQTLINLHYQNEEVHSYRQFDASGARIYEQCQGKVLGDPVTIHLDEDDFYSDNAQIIKTLNGEAYLYCFEYLPTNVEPYMSPFTAAGITPSPQHKGIALNQAFNAEQVSEQKLIQINKAISASANTAKLLVERGNLYFSRHEFELAVKDFDLALRQAPDLYTAYFGRGMAKGRMGLIQAGIDDLTIYLKKYPQSSLAYTKRGVRYIWLGDTQRAQRDLQKAIALDPRNAEARDDLGVIYASKNQLVKAVEQFSEVIKIDPSYQKGFHNLAMAQHLSGNSSQALRYINQALKISPDSKNSLLLKVEILTKLNKHEEAKTLLERAEYLPDGNWSEQFSITEN